MAQRTDHKTLQRLSAGESENNRAARVDRLAEALAATSAAARAPPAGLTCGRVDLDRGGRGAARPAHRGQPIRRLARGRPHRAGRAGAAAPGCAYDPDADRSIDALIASTDALEDRLLSNR